MDHRQHGPEKEQHPASYQAAKAATAVFVGSFLLLLSALAMAGTVVGLTAATPLLVIFSPVLVPAAIGLVLLCAGLVLSGGFGVAALAVLGWMYQYMTGKYPAVADQLEQAWKAIAGEAPDGK